MSELLRVVLIFVFGACVLGGGVCHLLAIQLAKKGSPESNATFETPPTKLVIRSASYAAVEGNGKDYDVADCLRQMICGNSLVMDIENHNFQINGRNYVPNDPKPFKDKRLLVTYSYDGESDVTLERQEHSRIVLPEDSEIKRLRDALRNAESVRKEPDNSSPDILMVDLQPTKGPDEKQLLVVTNRGQLQTFHAQCQLIGDSTGRPILKSYQLYWESGAVRGPLSRDESGNLVIAIAGKDRQNELSYIALRTASGGQWQSVEFQRWNFGDTPTDIKYRLNITVIGEETQTSKSQQFILRPGISSALEMIPADFSEMPDDGLLSPLQVEVFALARDLTRLLQEMPPKPIVNRADFQEGSEGGIAHFTAKEKAELPWNNRLRHTYAAKFADSVENILHRLAAENVSIVRIQSAVIAMPDEKSIRQIAEELPLLAVRLNYPSDRRQLRHES
jgi:hypothetical protein